MNPKCSCSGTYTAQIGDFVRTVSLVPVSGSTAIAYLDFLCDKPLIQAAAQGLAVRLDPLSVGCLVAPATGAIPLCYELSSLLCVPYVILRKGTRGYMGHTHSTHVRSSAAPGPEQLIVEDCYTQLLGASRVALLDTVTTTGSTFDAMTVLMQSLKVNVVARAVAFVEGDHVNPNGYVHLGRLPTFALAGNCGCDDAQ